MIERPPVKLHQLRYMILEIFFVISSSSWNLYTLGSFYFCQHGLDSLHRPSLLSDIYSASSEVHLHNHVYTYGCAACREYVNCNESNPTMFYGPKNHMFKTSELHGFSRLVRHWRKIDSLNPFQRFTSLNFKLSSAFNIRFVLIVKYKLIQIFMMQLE